MIKRKIVYSPVRDLNSRPLVYKTSALTTELTRLTHLQWSFTLDALNLFSRVCAFIQRTVYLTSRYETHILGWEHSINVVSDSYPGNKQKFLGLISEKKIFRRDSCWQGEVKGDNLCKGKYRTGTVQSIKMLPVTPRSKVLPETNNENFTLRKITF